MVGNDVVDLVIAERESNWRRNGFLQKVFTKKEHDYISSFHKPALMVWLLWSMKESAYKIFVQENRVRLLAPLKFQCSIHTCFKGNFSGEVISGKKSYFTFSKVSKDKISTTAYSDKITRVNSLSGGLKFSESGDSSSGQEIISSFISNVSEFLNITPYDLFLKKDELNIPYLFYKGNHLKSSISLSHHGRYGAYSAEFL
ncbi:MAG TPA: 4'-phosphopantetheinyl transferase superfamily protein [Ignavibacteriaceae bacterium]|nr:4'-phosphopantetheinyl transferase superfamily protein [Ignavibacteriaceae bacterium]